MSGARGRVWVRLGVAVAVVLASGAVAAEPSSGTAAAGGISGARRDYEALKAPAGNALEHPSIDLPTVPTLELSPEPAPPAAAGRARKLTEEEQMRELERAKEKSRHWLLEAMAQQAQPAPATPPAATRAEPATAELDRAAKLLALLEAISAPPAGGTLAAGESPAAEVDDLPVATNPLDRYMAAWMTPGDFKLLGPTPDPAATLGDGGFLARANAGASGVALPGSAELAGPGREQPTVENPYLREIVGLATVTASPADFAPPPIVTQPDPVPPVLAPAAPPEPSPPPSFSEQLKARDDAKYFKQLKRF